MDGALLIHDSSTNSIPSSEDQFVIGSMRKSVDHGELLVKRQRNDFGSGRSTSGRIRSTGGRRMGSQGGVRRGIEFGFRRRESFPYEKMGVTQFLESGPKDVQFRLQVLRTGNSKSPSKQATKYSLFDMGRMVGKIVYIYEYT